MRIIGGEKKGFKIIGPPSIKIKDLKPLPDKVREAIFNILGDWVCGKRVLDLYAGTGSVGLEALSRGAESVVFVERATKTTLLIKENLKKLGFRAEVFQKDATKFIKNTSEIFDLIYIGFPHQEIDFKVSEDAGQKLSKNGIIIFESDSKTEIPKIKNLKIFDQRTYGRLKITFLQY